MAFVRFPAHQVQWSAPPETFASSNLVERGFCAACGTPLTYRQIDGPNISLTLNSLDSPETVQPEMQFCPESQLPWCRLLDGLPTAAGDLSGAPDFVNHQR